MLAVHTHRDTYLRALVHQKESVSILRMLYVWCVFYVEGPIGLLLPHVETPSQYIVECGHSRVHTSHTRAGQAEVIYNILTLTRYRRLYGG